MKPTRNVYDSLSANRAVCGEPAQWNCKKSTFKALEEGHPEVWRDWFTTQGRDKAGLQNWINRTRTKQSKPT